MNMLRGYLKRLIPKFANQRGETTSVLIGFIAAIVLIAAIFPIIQGIGQAGNTTGSIQWLEARDYWVLAGGSHSVPGDLLPRSSNVYNIGSVAQRWKDIHANGTATIGGNVAATGSVSGATVTASGAVQGATVTGTGLNAGRPVITGVGGTLTDDAQLTYNPVTDTLTTVAITATNLTATNFTTTDLTGWTINTPKINENVALTATSTNLNSAASLATYAPKILGQIGDYTMGLGYGSPVATSGNPAVNTLYACPFVLPVTTTFDMIGMGCTTGVDTKHIRMGIYNDGGTNLPTTLLLDGGVYTFVGNGACWVATAAFSQQLSAGTYWLVFVTDTAGSTMQKTQINYALRGFNADAGGVPTFQTCYFPAQAYGALPALFPGTTLWTTGFPYTIGLRIKSIP